MFCASLIPLDTAFLRHPDQIYHRGLWVLRKCTSCSTIEYQLTPVDAFKTLLSLRFITNPILNPQVAPEPLIAGPRCRLTARVIARGILTNPESLPVA